MSNSRNLVCVRVQQFANWASVVNMGRHGTRTFGDLSHVDTNRTQLNWFESDWGDPHDPAACMQSLIEHHGARIRKNGSPGTHMLLTASPEYFRPDNPDGVGTWNQQRLCQWMDANRRWLRDRFPGQVAALRVDLDESTPHCDVFLVPLNWRTTKTGKKIVEVSHRTQFSKGRGPRAYATLQTEYAKAMEHLGLHRGEPQAQTGAVHKSPVTMRKELSQARIEATAYAEGIKAWTEGRMWDMGWTDDGRQRAKFPKAVTKPERRALFRLCRPAWRSLVDFSRVMTEKVTNRVKHIFNKKNVILAEAHAQADLLYERSQHILDELKDLDSMTLSEQQNRLDRIREGFQRDL